MGNLISNKILTNNILTHNHTLSVNDLTNQTLGVNTDGFLKTNSEEFVLTASGMYVKVA